MNRDVETIENEKDVSNLNIDGRPAAFSAGTPAAPTTAFRFISVTSRFLAVLAARRGINSRSGQRRAGLRLNMRNGFRGQILRGRSGQGRWQYRCHLHRTSTSDNPVAQALLCQKRGEYFLNFLVVNWPYKTSNFRPENLFLNRNKREYCPCGSARKP